MRPLNNGEMPTNTAYEDLCELLMQNHLASEQTLSALKVGCHPCNRGSLGLNGHNVHKNGHSMDQVGVDMKELGTATAFELCPLEPLRSQQLAFNQKLVEAIKGLLAPLNGNETVLSVGTGHWTAWIRAVMHGCRTPFQGIG